MGCTQVYSVVFSLVCSFFFLSCPFCGPLSQHLRSLVRIGNNRRYGRRSGGIKKIVQRKGYFQVSQLSSTVYIRFMPGVYSFKHIIHLESDVCERTKQVFVFARTQDITSPKKNSSFCNNAGDCDEVFPPA